MEATLEAPPAAVQPQVATPGPRAVEPPDKPSKSLDEALLEQAGPGTKLPTPRNQPSKPPVKPDAAKPAEKPADAKVAEKPADAPKPGEVAKPQVAPEPEKGKFNPVKELKTARTRISELEAKLADTVKRITPDNDRTTLTTRMEAIQKRNEELENLVRFRDYEHSKEFQETYHKPYEKALATAMGDLKRIPIAGADGQPRPANEQDLFEIVNLVHSDLAQARHRSVEVFGDLAPDVMDMAKKVRDTLVARNEALDAEKVNGKTREQQTREQNERQSKALAAELEGLWKEENEAVINNPKDPGLAEILKPITPEEGKQATPDEIEHNAALEKGFKLVDEAFKFVDTVRRKGAAASPEEKRAVAKRLATVRNRAAGFGPLRRKYNAALKELKTVKATLATYEDTAPPAGGHRPTGAANKGGKGGKLTDSIDWESYRR